jgi:hypothetical protein
MNLTMNPAAPASKIRRPRGGCLSRSLPLIADFFRLLLLALMAGTAIQARAQTATPLSAGWNLLGNGSNAALNVATVFGNQTNVGTVWKWVAAKGGWAFYAPSMDMTTLQAYATGKGYDVLTTINGGEGFWVNAKIDFTAQLPAGTAVQSASFQNMPAGWNLIAIGDNKTPSQFNLQLGATPPAPGVVPLILTTLWAWDALLTNWYFYAPSMEASGGLASYVTGKGYLNFGSKALGPTMGFWVNYPGGPAGTAPASTTTVTTAATTVTVASTTTTTPIPTTTTSTTSTTKAQVTTSGTIFTTTTTVTVATTTTTTAIPTTTTTASTTSTTAAAAATGPLRTDTVAFAKAMVPGSWTYAGYSCSAQPNPRIQASYFLCPAGGLRGAEDAYVSATKYSYVAKGTWSVASTPSNPTYASVLLNYTTSINVGGVLDTGAGVLGKSAGYMLYDAPNDRIAYYYNSCWLVMKRLADGSNQGVDDSYCQNGGPSATNQCKADYDCGRCFYCEKSSGGNMCRYGGEGPSGCYRGWSPPP